MEFTIEESGARVIINECSLEQAFKLKSTIQKELLRQKIEIKDVDFEDMGQVVNILMALDSSEEVFNCLFECLKKSSYNGIRIAKDTFDTPDKWGDLYEIFFYCLKVNISPFYKNLLSKWKNLGQGMSGKEDLGQTYPTI